MDVKHKTLIFAICFLMGFTAPVFAQAGVVILNYHHVGAYHEDGKLANPYTVTPQVLRMHFEYLKQNGYRTISVDEYIRYNRGEVSLPEKSVLITFDDAYVSFYDQALPLLKEYNYPAVLAMVGIWQKVPPGNPDGILNWDQAREIMKTGLVEIASHSYNLHYPIAANPFGDKGYAMTTLEYSNGRYEELSAYKIRVQEDMVKNQELFEKELGRKARIMVWPYGEYNAITVEAALAAGFEVTFGLEGGINPQGRKSLYEGKRGIITDNPGTDVFSKFLADAGDTEKKISVVQLDLDSIYDPDKRQLEANISAAVDRISSTGVNTVYLQAFVDDKGDGKIQQVYFMNSVAPVKADVFSHVVQRLRNARVRVYAWIPSLTGQWLLRDHPEDIVIAYNEKGKGWYDRATPFSPRVREELKVMARELAMYAPVNGVMFQDDLYLNDYEDFSPVAKQAFRKRFGKELTPEALGDPAIKATWTKMKTEALTEISQGMMDAMRSFQPNFRSARNIYAEAVINPKAVDWFAQDFQEYLKTYDYTVIMAYPYMEKQSNRTVVWLQELADAALKDKANAEKIVFKLQNYDWQANRWVPRDELSREVRALRGRGAIHLGYYPENLFSDYRNKSPF